MKSDADSFKVVKENIAYNSNEFELAAKALVKDKEEKGEIQIYAYKIIKLNTETFMYEVTKYNMSELFVALLGASPQ